MLLSSVSLLLTSTVRAEIIYTKYIYLTPWYGSTKNMTYKNLHAFIKNERKPGDTGLHGSADKHSEHIVGPVQENSLLNPAEPVRICVSTLLSVNVETLFPWSEATEILLPKNICEGYQLGHLQVGEYQFEHLQVGECHKSNAFCSDCHLFMLLGSSACPMLPGSIHFSFPWSRSSI